MPIPVIIDGTTYQLPVQGQDPTWGDDLSDIIQALVAVSSGSTGPGDILPSTFTLANNQTSPAAVTGLIFDEGTIRGAEISYSIDRATSTQEVTENGTLYINYNSTTNTWSQSQISNGNAQVLFSVISGQIFFTSSNMGGANYAGKMGFRGVAFEQ